MKVSKYQPGKKLWLQKGLRKSSPKDGFLAAEMELLNSEDPREALKVMWP